MPLQHPFVLEKSLMLELDLMLLLFRSRACLMVSLTSESSQGTLQGSTAAHGLGASQHSSARREADGIEMVEVASAIHAPTQGAMVKPCKLDLGTRLCSRDVSLDGMLCRAKDLHMDSATRVSVQQDECKGAMAVVGSQVQFQLSAEVLVAEARTGVVLLLCALHLLRGRIKVLQTRQAIAVQHARVVDAVQCRLQNVSTDLVQGDLTEKADAAEDASVPFSRDRDECGRLRFRVRSGFTVRESGSRSSLRSRGSTFIHRRVSQCFQLAEHDPGFRSAVRTVHGAQKDAYTTIDPLFCGECAACSGDGELVVLPFHFSIQETLPQWHELRIGRQDLTDL
ncbi:hypothetical protein, partial [Aquabacterium sp.]|uniref:hypothetical protein n=1 Tax=Aquabacterium sp. TaxID=1872578 RepID=UPI00248718AE